ncbi:MAG TPA: hypothetical protein VII94_03840 [Candidatus Saccharimonadales bacterium]
MDQIDPNTPIAANPGDVDTSKIGELADNFAKGSEGAAYFNTTISASNGFLAKLNDLAGSVGGSIGNLGAMAGESASKFGLLAAGILGAKEQFTNLSGVKTDNLLTYSGQFKTLIETVKGSPAATTSIKMMTDAMTAAHAPAGLIAKAVKEMGSGVLTTAEAFLVGADNNLRLQESIMQTTMHAGGLNEAFTELRAGIPGIGKDLSGLNEITNKYTKALEDSRYATHLSMDTLAEYGAQLTSLPGGLKSLLTSTELAGKGTNILTVAIQYARGSGRDLADVFKDMTEATTRFGTSTDDAVKYSARMSEVSNVLGARQEDVRAGLLDSSEAFKMFAGAGSNANGMTQGMANAMSDYVKQLEGVGVPARNAIEMFGHYSKALATMTIGQQAFMSAQTGGPGGFMGAFQMMDLIKNKPEVAMKKMQDTIKKQMGGHMVSYEEAKHSDAAGAKLNQQIQLILNGPMGKLANSPEEAVNLSEAIRTGGKMPTVGEHAKAAAADMDNAINTGKEDMERSNVIAGINDNVSAIKTEVEKFNNQTLQNLGAGTSVKAGGVGGTGAGIPVNQDVQRNQQRAAQIGTLGSGSEVAMKNLGSSITNTPSAIKDAVLSLKEQMGGSLVSFADAQKSPEAAMKYQRQLSQNMQIPALNPGDAMKKFTPLDDFKNPGQQVAKAAKMAHTAGTAAMGGRTDGNSHSSTGGAAGGIHAGPTGQPVPVIFAPGATLKVNFTGSCPHCGKPVNSSTVATSINAAATNPRI